MPTAANSMNVSASGLVNFDGNHTFSAVTTTNHDVLVGAASNSITNVAPSATSGIPLVSNGSSSDPSFTTAVVAGGGTGDTSFTAYMPIVGGTSTTGALQSVATGTQGQVLTFQSTSSLPTWTGAGSLVLIQSQTASNSAAINFTTGITSTYNNYLLLFSSVIPITNSVSLELQVSTNGGSSYIATGYQSGLQEGAYNSSTGIAGNLNSTTFIYLGQSIANTASTGVCGAVYLMDFRAAVFPKIVGNSTSSSGITQVMTAAYRVASTINAFTVFMSSGNISSGTFTLFGILE